jgi:MFS transporter, CP family, cyanate transporter
MSTDIRTGSLRSETRAISAFCLLLLSFALRPGIVSIGPVLLHIRHEFGLTYSEVALLTSIPDVCMGFFVLCVPAISRRLGTDRTVFLSLVLLGVAILLRALTHSTDLLLFWTMLVGIGIAIAGALIGGWIKEHFPQQSSLFMSIYAGGLSIGATMAAGATSYISDAFGSWRMGAGVWCGLALAGIASWSYLARRVRATHINRPHEDKKPAIELPWKSRRAWVLAIFFGLSQFVVYACLAWLAPWNSEMHASQIPSGMLLGVFTIFLAVGSFAVGAIANRSADRRPSLALGATVTFAGFVGLTFAPTSYPIMFIVMIAFGQGMCFALGMTLPLDNAATSTEAHAWTMFVLFVGYMIAALGPLSFGYLRDWTGRFFDSCMMLLIISAILLAMIPLLKRSTQATRRAS